MKRAWIGIALLSVSWLMALGYYHAADQANPAWAALIVVGAVLLTRVMRAPRREEGLAAVPSAAQAAVAAALLLPVLVVAPWPYKAVPLVLAVGLVGWAILVWDEDAPHGDRWLRGLAGGAMVAGTVLVVQQVTMLGYEAITARSHELPRPLAELVAMLARLLGMNTTIDGQNNVVVYAFRESQRFAATWDLLADPATVAFLAGGLVLQAIAGGQGRAGLGSILRAMAGLAVIVIAWMPVRAVLFVAIYMHRLLRTDYDAPLDLMDQFWSVWVHLLMLAGPVVMASVLIGSAEDKASSAPAGRRPWAWTRVASAGLVGLGIAAISGGIFWCPVGTRQGGRVLVDEHHSRWEDTRVPFDTKRYGHLSTYTYSVIYDYCDRFYRMGRIEEPLSEKVLADCDVLIVKLPTSPYSSQECEAIRRFVSRGGGLMLVGEHTNVFTTGQNLNQVGRMFGVQFGSDCLFDVDTFFKQQYQPNIVPHPVLQYLPLEKGGRRFDFEVSCSVDPGQSPGRAAIRSVGLKQLTEDYYADNFYPQAQNHAYMRSGAFEQLWTSEYGQGRVLAFGDSTVFSNFCIFEPGKSELFLGMLEWLNHRHTLDPRVWLVAAGAVLLAAGLVLSLVVPGSMAILVAAGLLGWAATAYGANVAHARAMPVLQPRAGARPIVQVCFDRQISGGKLPLGGFISGEEDGYGIFEMWMLRQGYFTHRLGENEDLHGDVVVYCNPDKPVTDEYRSRLEVFVKEGGRVLVIDAPRNQRPMTTSLLQLFGLSVKGELVEGGTLTGPEGWPAVAVPNAWEVEGGTVLAKIGDKPVAAVKQYGKGSVTMIGFGGRFCDLRMGVTADVEPNEEQQAAFDLEYAIVRSIVARAAAGVGN